MAECFDHEHEIVYPLYAPGPPQWAIDADRDVSPLGPREKRQHAGNGQAVARLRAALRTRADGVRGLVQRTGLTDRSVRNLLFAGTRNRTIASDHHQPATYTWVGR